MQGKVRIARPDSMERMILDEFVNVATEALGVWCEKQGIPALYRTQALPSQLPLEAGAEQEPKDSPACAPACCARPVPGSRCK